MPLDLDDELDRLYGADLEGFVAERKRIAAALRKEGRKAEATRVLELRKPSVPAWVVNQLVRRRRKDVDQLLEAGEGLEQAQTALLGGDRAGFANARGREQEVLKRLRQGARTVLGDRSSDAMLERVVSTLGSAAVTAEGREQLVAGRLTGEISPRGFEAFAGLATSAAAPAPPPRRQAASDDGRHARRKEATAGARAALKAARDNAADVAARRRETDRALQAARKALDAAERAAAEIEADAEAAADAVEAARRELEAAKEA